MARRSARKQDPIDAMIEREYYAQGEGVQVSVLDIGKIFADCRPAAQQGAAALTEAMKQAIAKYRKN